MIDFIKRYLAITKSRRSVFNLLANERKILIYFLKEVTKDEANFYLFRERHYNYFVELRNAVSDLKHDNEALLRESAGRIELQENFDNFFGQKFYPGKFLPGKNIIAKTYETETIRKILNNARGQQAFIAHLLNTLDDILDSKSSYKKRWLIIFQQIPKFLAIFRKELQLNYDLITVIKSRGILDSKRKTLLIFINIIKNLSNLIGNESLNEPLLEVDTDHYQSEYQRFFDKYYGQAYRVANSDIFEDKEKEILTSLLDAMKEKDHQRISQVIFTKRASEFLGKGVNFFDAIAKRMKQGLNGKTPRPKKTAIRPKNLDGRPEIFPFPETDKTTTLQDFEIEINLPEAARTTGIGENDDIYLGIKIDKMSDACINWLKDGDPKEGRVIILELMVYQINYKDKIPHRVDKVIPSSDNRLPLEKQAKYQRWIYFSKEEFLKEMNKDYFPPSDYLFYARLIQRRHAAEYGKEETELGKIRVGFRIIGSSKKQDNSGKTSQEYEEAKESKIEIPKQELTNYTPPLEGTWVMKLTPVNGHPKKDLLIISDYIIGRNNALEIGMFNEALETPENDLNKEGWDIVLLHGPPEEMIEGVGRVPQAVIQFVDGRFMILGTRRSEIMLDDKFIAPGSPAAIEKDTKKIKVYDYEFLVEIYKVENSPMPIEQFNGQFKELRLSLKEDLEAKEELRKQFKVVFLSYIGRLKIDAKNIDTQVYNYLMNGILSDPNFAKSFRPQQASIFRVILEAVREGNEESIENLSKTKHFLDVFARDYDAKFLKKACRGPIEYKRPEKNSGSLIETIREMSEDTRAASQYAKEGKKAYDELRSLSEDHLSQHGQENKKSWIDRFFRR